MTTGFNFKNHNFLKLVTLVILTLSILMFVKYFEPLSRIIFKSENPLLTKYISYYIAFLSCFILSFFVIIMSLSGRMLTTRYYPFKMVYSLLGM